MDREKWGKQCRLEYHFPVVLVVHSTLTAYMVTSFIPIGIAIPSYTMIVHIKI